MVSSQSQVQSDQGDEIFLAFKEWLNAQEARHGRVVNPREYRSSDSQRKEFHVSPSIAALEPSIGMNPRQVSIQSDGISSDRPSMGRRVFRTFAYGFIVTVIVGAALAWEFGEDKTKDIVGGWGISLSGLSSVLGTKSPTGPDVPAFKNTDQVSVAGGSSTEQQQQLGTVVNDLAVVRGIVEQIAAKQEQMAQEIAKLQAAEQTVNEKTSSLPRSSGGPPRKNVQTIVHSEAAAQLPTVPVPTPRPQTPLPLR
jgi:outer membrane murein-binding lipoprotein Lpp